MKKLVLSRRWLLTALLALGLAIPAAGWPGKGNGGGGGGGEDPPPANDPGVRFTPVYFSIPGTGYYDEITDVNNSGQVVGHYGSDYRAFVYDMLWETGQAVDLNDITIDIPAGHYIRKATGINEAGQISVYLDDSTQEGLQLSAGMVDLKHKDAEGTTVPKLYLVPNPDNRFLLATDINDQGDLAIRDQTTGTTGYPALLIYNFGLTDPDLAMEAPLELLAEIGSVYPHINNRTQNAGPQIVGGTPNNGAFRLTVGGNYETFPPFYYDTDGNLVRTEAPAALNNLGEFCGAAYIDLVKKYKGATRGYTNYVRGDSVEFVGAVLYTYQNLSNDAWDINDSSDVLRRNGIMHHGRAGEFHVSDWLNATDNEIAAFKETFLVYTTVSDRVVPDTDVPMVTAHSVGPDPTIAVILIPESIL